MKKINKKNIGIGVFLKNLIVNQFDSLFVFMTFTIVTWILWDLFVQGQYQWIIGHEGVHYLLRSILFHYSFCGGDFIPRWSTEMLSGYGYPFFLFYGNGSFFFSEFIRFVGSGFSTATFCSDAFIQPLSTANPYQDSIMSVNQAWNIMTFLSYLLSGIGMYFLMKQFVTKIPAFCAALIFIFFPYHIGEIFMRGDVAEALAAYTCVVWAFYFAVRFIREQNLKFLIFSAAFLAATIFTHTVSGLMWLPIFALFTFWFSWSEQVPKKVYGWLLIGGLLGLALAAFYFLPAMLEKEFVHIERLFNSPFLPEIHRNNNILSLQYDMKHIIQSPYGFTKIPALSFGIVILAFSALFFLFSKNFEKGGRKFLGFWVGIFFLGVLLNSDFSRDLVPKLGEQETAQMERGMRAFFEQKFKDNAVISITEEERKNGVNGITREDIRVVIPMAGKYVQDYVFGKINKIKNSQDLDLVVARSKKYIKNGNWKSIDVSGKNACEKIDEINPKTGALSLVRRDWVSAFWEKFPLVCALQFSWRLQVWLAFAVAIFAGFLAQSFITVKTSRLALVGLFASVIWTANIPFLKETSWSAENYEKHNKSYYFSGDLHKILKHEFAPAYTSVVGDEYAIRTVPEEFNTSISKMANPADMSKLHINDSEELIEVTEYKHTPTTFEYKLNLTSPKKVWIEHFYFPGWKVFVGLGDLEMQEIDIELNKNGLISFNLPTGNLKVKVEFTKVSVVKSAETISWIALILSLLGLLFGKKLNNIFFKKEKIKSKSRKKTIKKTTSKNSKKVEKKAIKTTVKITKKTTTKTVTQKTEKKDNLKNKDKKQKPTTKKNSKKTKTIKK